MALVCSVRKFHLDILHQLDVAILLVPLQMCRQVFATHVCTSPYIRQCCFETDADVPDAMLTEMGERVKPYIEKRGAKFFPDLQGINEMLLREVGVQNIVDSGICTKCECDTFWSHRATHGRRGVHAGAIMLPEE